LIKRGFVHFIELKEANRDLHTQLETEKEKHTQYKEKLNALNLKLQNLQYEKNHFMREIEICKNFRSLLSFLPNVIQLIQLITTIQFVLGQNMLLRISLTRKNFSEQHQKNFYHKISMTNMK
jgi:hypothetical protein